MPSLLRELIVIAAFVAAGSGYTLFTGLAPSPWVKGELDAGEIKYEDAEVIDAIWVDARSEAMFAQAHLPGAFSLNDANWEDNIIPLTGAWLENPRPLIVYCSSESCDTSKRIAARLRAVLPDAEIYSLHGGWPQ